VGLTGTWLRVRERVYSNLLGLRVENGRSDVTRIPEGFSDYFVSHGAGDAAAHALGTLSSEVEREANVLAHIDGFWLCFGSRFAALAFVAFVTRAPLGPLHRRHTAKGPGGAERTATFTIFTSEAAIPLSAKPGHSPRAAKLSLSVDSVEKPLGCGPWLTVSGEKLGLCASCGEDGGRKGDELRRLGRSDLRLTNGRSCLDVQDHPCLRSIR